MYKSAQLDTKRDHLYIEWRPSAGHMAISRAAFQALARDRLMPLGPAETPLMFCYLENPLLLPVLSPGVSFLLPLSSSGTQGASAHTHTHLPPHLSVVRRIHRKLRGVAMRGSGFRDMVAATMVATLSNLYLSILH